MKLIIGGIDPSFRATGLAKATYNVEEGTWSVYSTKLIETEKASGKQIRVNSDDLRRANILTAGIHGWLMDCDVAMAEIPSGAQSASAAKGLGIAMGILGTVGEVGLFRGKLIQVMPQENKKLFCGSKNASKDDMIEEAMRRWPGAGWVLGKSGASKGKPINSNEHAADACGVINAGVQSDEFRSLVQAMKAMAKR